MGGIKDRTGSRLFQNAIRSGSGNLFSTNNSSENTTQLPNETKVKPMVTEETEDISNIASTTSTSQEFESLEKLEVGDELTALLKRCETLIQKVQANMSDRIKDSEEGCELLDANIHSSTSTTRKITSTSVAGQTGVTQVLNEPRQEIPGLVLILQVVCPLLRHLRYPQSRTLTLAMLIRLCSYCSDDVLLQRVIPVVVNMLDDSVPIVRASALRCLRAVLSPVRQISSIETTLFPRYVFPALSRVAKDSEVVVRIAFAECLGCLAECSRRFLEYGHHALLRRATNAVNPTSPSTNTPLASTKQSIHTVRVDGNTYESILIPTSYDSQLQSLHQTVSRWVRDLVIMDGVSSVNSSSMRSGVGSTSMSQTYFVEKSILGVSNSSERLTQGLSSAAGRARATASCVTSHIKRVLLVDIKRLCVFFGPDGVVDLLLPQLLTFLNDPDWELRLDFCLKIPTVCAYVGPAVTALCVLPCLALTALVDQEQRVVRGALQCLHDLIALRLLSPQLVQEAVRDATPLIIHPSKPIRASAIQLVEIAVTVLGTTDAHVFLLPLIRPVLKFDLLGAALTAKNITAACVEPISWDVYRNALSSHRQSGLSTDMEESTLTWRTTGGLDQSIDSEFFTDDGLAGAGTGAGLSSVESSHVSGDVSGSALYDSEELSKLQILQPYLQLAAKEANRSTRGNISSYNSLHNSFSEYSPIHSIQTLYIPNMKYILHNASLSLEYHKRAIRLLKYQNTSDRYRNTSGMDSNPVAKGGVVFLETDLPQSQQLENAVQNQEDISIEYIQALYGIASSQSNPTVDTNQVDQQGTSSNPLTSGSTDLDVTDSVSTSLSFKSLSSTRRPRLPSISNATNNNDLSAVNLDMISNNTSGNQRPFSVQSNSYGVYTEEVSQLLSRINALNIPPLPLDLGTLRQPDGRKFSIYTDVLDCSSAVDGHSRPGAWRPRENALIGTLTEHTDSVNRVTVSPDQSYFVTASSDCTAKVWQTAGLDRSAFPRSCVTYSGHSGRLVDIVALENSHSIASCSDDGSVHLWRVETAHASTSFSPTASDRTRLNTGLSVSGSTSIYTLAPEEGPIIALNHYNTDSSSILLYCTLYGGFHGWDIRTSSEIFHISIRTELGYPTSMTLAPDRTWVCIGTSLGYICLWDLRIHIMSKLWRHSLGNVPIHRLACSKNSNPNRNIGAYLFVAAGISEAAVWSLPDGGDCLKCFRSIPSSNSSVKEIILPLPSLNEITIPAHPNIPLLNNNRIMNCNIYNSIEPSVRALVGRMSSSGPAHLITAGTDRQIRFWDFNIANRSFTVSGLDPGQPRSSYESPTELNRLVICRDASIPSADVLVQSQKPLLDGHGPVPPVQSFRDAILDLKCIDLPMKMMVSCGRDGDVKLWK